MSGLDRQKVNRLTAARRATMRARSYCLVGFYACLVCAAELVWMAAWRIVELRQIVRPFLYSAAVVGLLWFARKLLQRARHLKEEAKSPPSDPPNKPPDFSGLSDGSQIARDLEEMR